MFGQRDYSMRVWLDPDKLAIRNMTAGDVVAALREQNLQVAAGQIGQSPTVKGQQTQVTLTTLGRLVEPEQFDKVIIKKTPDGRLVRIRDVGRVELGAKNQDINSKVDGQPVANLAIFQLPDANALDTADIVKAKIAEMKKDFPEGLDYMIRYDTTPFIRESIQEVFKTLLDSVMLVAPGRPVVPAKLAVGDHSAGGRAGGDRGHVRRDAGDGLLAQQPDAVRAGAGDRNRGGRRDRGRRGGRTSHRARAEAARRHAQGDERGLGARDRGGTGTLRRVYPLCVHLGDHRAVLPAIRADDRLVDGDLDPQLTDPEPRAGGDALEAARKGVYNTLPWPAYAMVGAWVGYAWILPYLMSIPNQSASWPRVDDRPASCAATSSRRLPASRENGPALLGGPFDGRCRPAWRSAGRRTAWSGSLVRPVQPGVHGDRERLCAARRGHAPGVRPRDPALRGPAGTDVLRASSNTPRGFIPSQDMGYLLVNIQLPDSAAAERTQAVLDRINEIAHEIPGVNATVGVCGQSLLLNAFGSNFGTMFVTLDGFDKRKTADLYYEVIANKCGAAGGRDPRRQHHDLRAPAGARAWAGPAAS